MSRVLQGSVFVEPDLMTTGTPHVDFGLFHEPRLSTSGTSIYVLPEDQQFVAKLMPQIVAVDGFSVQASQEAAPGDGFEKSKVRRARFVPAG